MWMVIVLISVAEAIRLAENEKYSYLSSPASSKSVDCGLNAYWDDCPPDYPPHQNCSLLWSEFECEPDENYCCRPACRCEDGFYRDEYFKCVSSEHCIARYYIDQYAVTEVVEEVEEPNKCPANETMAWCVVDCAYKYCPTNDSRAVSRCQSPRGNCPQGCVCQWNYKRLSVTDRRCILASDCPPVKCTRPNEVWNPCPSPCYRENCRNRRTEPKICTYKGLNTCEPRCTCIQGYYRDQFDDCIPAADCDKTTFTSDLRAE
ncbi:uncharacterized protein LOC113229232 [Hyposmocoma kahamanoa]|uniref:uncharacterized protein LOC113229232 n=1 Tax=Hyposmocoma kahamanoa TaxID=1477025 RepID=UPI000E6D670D|nr:uncharacterized protein LOC113229232 [Hyposmocoma kahamanoa]